jgi:hypothetical protein
VEDREGSMFRSPPTDHRGLFLVLALLHLINIFGLQTRFKQFNGVLIKKACEHSDCPHTRCVKSIRLGGIEI